VKEPVWIKKRDALALHSLVVTLDRAASGVRDEGLLESALARPRHLRAYGKKASIVDLAAAYLAGIVRNRPFVDGNKRTGFVVGVLFLELNGYRFHASEEEAANAVFDVAAGRMDDAALGRWLSANTERIVKRG
jgi:death on curing protein